MLIDSYDGEDCPRVEDSNVQVTVEQSSDKLKEYKEQLKRMLDAEVAEDNISIEEIVGGERKRQEQPQPAISIWSQREVDPSETHRNEVDQTSLI